MWCEMGCDAAQGTKSPKGWVFKFSWTSESCFFLYLFVRSSTFCFVCPYLGVKLWATMRIWCSSILPCNKWGPGFPELLHIDLCRSQILYQRHCCSALLSLIRVCHMRCNVQKTLIKNDSVTFQPNCKGIKWIKSSDKQQEWWGKKRSREKKSHPMLRLQNDKRQLQNNHFVLKMVLNVILCSPNI